MNNNLSTHSLAAMNKAQLLEMMQEALDYAQDGGKDELHEALQQIEAVSYVLQNCNYEGSEA
jgi:hypothetical protein